jgi:hypothetical protein
MTFHSRKRTKFHRKLSASRFDILARDRPTFQPGLASFPTTDRPSSNLGFGREGEEVDLDHAQILKWGEVFNFCYYSSVSILSTEVEPLLSLSMTSGAMALKNGS